MEQNQTSRPLLAERAAAWLVRLFRQHQTPFLSSFLFGLLAYTYAFTNKLINHDEAGQLFSKGETVTSGRFGLAVMDTIFPNYSMPWIYGLITVLLISISICIIIHVFAIRSKLVQVLLAGTIIVFPSLIGTFGFMFTATSYGVSFLLASLALWFLQKKEKLWAIPALICMIGSLSIYQSYISVTASLLVVLLIQRLLTEEDAFPVLKQGFYYLGFLVLSLALYFAASKVVLLLKDTDFNTYAAGAMSENLPSIVERVILAYSCFVRFFTESYNGLIPTAFSQLLHLLLAASMVVLLMVWLLRAKKPNALRLLLLLALLGVLPLSINCMYLIVAASNVHTLVLYGFIAFYVLIAMIADTLLPEALPKKPAEMLRRIALEVIAAAFALVILVNVYVANASYLNLYLSYENAYAFYSSVLTEVRMDPEFDAQTELALVGYYQRPNYRYEHFEFVNNIAGVYGFFPDSYSKNRFLEFYMGTHVTFSSDKEIAAIRETEEYQQMPYYPNAGAIRRIGDTMVVKLSD